jgi:hypothetical protein
MRISSALPAQQARNFRTPAPHVSRFRPGAYASPPVCRRHHGTQHAGLFYVTPTGNDLAALRQEHNRAAMADLAAHEGFPGHDWHYTHWAHAAGN